MQPKRLHPSKDWLPASAVGFYEVFALLLNLFHHNDTIFWCFILAYETKERKMKFFVTVIRVSIFSSTLSPHTQKPRSLLKEGDLWTCKTQEVNQYVMMERKKKEKQAGVTERLVDGNYWHAWIESIQFTY